MNRRHLRIKVLQELYAFYQTEESDYVTRERELVGSVEKIYDQYLFWMSVFRELRYFAENKIEENKSKRLPTKEDLSPNTRFIDNKVFELFAVNQNLRAEIEKRKLGWSNEQDIIKKLFKEIASSETYALYMSDDDNDLETHKQFAVKIFKDVIANFDLIHYYLEEKSIFWVDDIDLVCSMVIKTIKLIDADFDEFTRMPTLYKQDDDEEEFFKTLFRRTVSRDEETSELIVSKTDNWELDRIAKMDVILMKMAITEALEFNTIPVKVTLNEYIEISKFYSTPKSNGFINGILDRVFEELKKRGDLKKVGRGLIE